MSAPLTPRIKGLVLIELAEGTAIVSARAPGQCGERPFSDLGAARRFALNQAEQRGWLLVDMTGRSN